MRKIDRSIIKENTEKLKELLRTQEKPQLIFRIRMLIFPFENPNSKLEEVTNLLPISYE